MKLFGKEKEVVDLIQQHCAKTGEVLIAASDVIKRIIGGRETPSDHDARRAGQLEEDADQLLREARQLMYSGAYLPLIRADIYRLLSRVDDVANEAEQSCDVACLQVPEIPEEHRADLLTILDLTVSCFSELSAALAQYLDRKGDVKQMRQHLGAVSRLESEVDGKARELTRGLFRSGIPKADKLHLQAFLDSITRISDVTEDAADMLNLLGVKSIV